MPAPEPTITRHAQGRARDHRARGRRARGELRSARDSRRWTKHGNSPVSEADIAVDNFLRERLRGSLPDAGWLSEETEDDPRAARRRAALDRRSDRRHPRLSSPAARLDDLGRAGRERPAGRGARVRAGGRRLLSGGRRRGRDAQRRRDWRRARATSFERRARGRPEADPRRLARVDARHGRRAEGAFARAAHRPRRVGRLDVAFAAQTATTGTLRRPTFWCTKPAAC